MMLRADIGVKRIRAKCLANRIGTGQTAGALYHAATLFRACRRCRRVQGVKGMVHLIRIRRSPGDTLARKGQIRDEKRSARMNPSRQGPSQHETLALLL